MPAIFSHHTFLFFTPWWCTIYYILSIFHWFSFLFERHYEPHSSYISHSSSYHSPHLHRPLSYCHFIQNTFISSFHCFTYTIIYTSFPWILSYHILHSCQLPSSGFLFHFIIDLMNLHSQCLLSRWLPFSFFFFSCHNSSFSCLSAIHASWATHRHTASSMGHRILAFHAAWSWCPHIFLHFHTRALLLWEYHFILYTLLSTDIFRHSQDKSQYRRLLCHSFSSLSQHRMSASSLQQSHLSHFLPLLSIYFICFEHFRFPSLHYIFSCHVFQFLHISYDYLYHIWYIDMPSCFQQAGGQPNSQRLLIFSSPMGFRTSLASPCFAPVSPVVFTKAFANSFR